MELLLYFNINISLNNPVKRTIIRTVYTVPGERIASEIFQGQLRGFIETTDDLHNFDAIYSFLFRDMNVLVLKAPLLLFCSKAS